MAKKLLIRTEPGKSIERDVPDISLEPKPEYPNKWFSDHPGKRPIVRIPKSNLTEDQLLARMDDFWISDPNIEPTLEFLFYFITKYLKERLSEDWRSYNRTIGKKDEILTPLILLDVERYSTVYSPDFGSKLKPEDETGRFATIMAIHRTNTTLGGIGNYLATVIRQMENTLRDQPYRLTALDPGLISAKVSLGSNETFRKIVAAVDMFYNKSPNSTYAKIKVATLSARDKDCGGLVAISDLASYLGEPTVSALSYAMDPRIASELVRLTEELDEISKPDSYFHYLREMGLSNKSPYSFSMNPALYNFAYSVGTFMGNRRACNARLFSDTGFTNTVNIAILK